jgi:peptidoglycan biosynthesis protein MviN/MurJ (putative lipid II flippase)
MNKVETGRGQQGVSGETLPNGPGAAAILAAGIGSAALGVFALAGDAVPAINRFFNFYNPSGALSGVSAAAVIVWLVAWWVLGRRWATATVPMAKVNLISFLLLAVGVLLTFPPFMDLLQGK